MHKEIISLFKHLFPNASFLYPLKTSENLKGFLMFSGVREKLHWEKMGYCIS